MEQLIRELNVPANQGAPQRINEIQKQIQHLQREKSAWQLGLSFLQHNDALIRFYGALTLTIKINADWDHDNLGADDDLSNSLLVALIGSYVRLTLAGDANFVLQKLCSTLSALQQRLGFSWPFPVRHVFACLINHNYIEQQSLTQLGDVINLSPHIATRQLSGAVRLSMTLLEDASTRLATANDQAVVQLSKSCLDTFQLLSYCLTGLYQASSNSAARPELAGGNGLNESEPFTTDLARICLQAVPLWIPQLKIQAAHAPKSEVHATNKVVVECVSSVLKFAQHDTLSANGIQCLIAIQQFSPKLLIKADLGFPESFAKSNLVKRLVVELQSGDFSHESVLLVELLEAIMTQVDLSTPEYLISGQYSEVLQALLGLLRCDGIAMIEDTICQVVLESIVMIVEGYTDWEHDAGTLDSSLDSLDFLKDFVRQACESCLMKIKMPPEAMEDASSIWDADDRAKFHDFRMDVQDFLQSAFNVLGVPLIEAIVSTLTLSQAGWSNFEASVFCLIAFSDTMTADPVLYDPLVEAALTSDYFKLVMESDDVPGKARNTSIRFLTEMTAYLQRYPHLMEVLNFLFSSLHQPSLVGNASRAIYTLCDAERSFLTPALPNFIDSLATISDLHGIDRHRIYGGVAAVVQSLPDEVTKVQPLSRILECVSQAADSVDPNDIDGVYLEHLTDVLETMAAIGRGLRAPNDAPIDIEASTPTDTFWMGGSGSQVQERVIALYTHVIKATGGKVDATFIEAACDFLRSGFTEDHPSPFKFSSAVSTDLVKDHISLDSPNIDAVMGCASSLLASAQTEDFDPFLARLIHQVMTCGQDFLTGYQLSQSLGDSNFPSASLDFVSRLLPKWVDKILSAGDGQDFVGLFVQLAVLVISEPDPLPRRSAASFFSALVDVGKRGKSIEATAKEVLEAQMKLHSPRILAVLLRLIGGECARSELDVLTDPLRRYAQHQPMLFKSICREATKKESFVLTEKALQSTTPEQRSRFIAQMDSLRGGRKSNDVVREFWIACRGSGFGYIA